MRKYTTNIRLCTAVMASVNLQDSEDARFDNLNKQILIANNPFRKLRKLNFTKCLGNAPIMRRALFIWRNHSFRCPRANRNDAPK